MAQTCRSPMMISGWCNSSPTCKGELPPACTLSGGGKKVGRLMCVPWCVPWEVNVCTLGGYLGRLMCVPWEVTLGG